MTQRLLRFARLSPVPLDKNLAHVFAANHALCLYRANAIYTMIPKNGCSTLRYSLGLANGVLAGPEDLDWIHANNRAFRADMGDLLGAAYSFVVLRDPHRRLASGFLDKMVASRPVQQTFTTASGLDRPIGDLTFRDFVQALAKGPEVLTADKHWRPQSDFLVYERYDDVFCLERFDQAVAVLQERIGLTVTDTRAMLGHGSDGFQPTPPGELHADTPIAALAQLQRKGRRPPAQALFDADLTAQVTALYAADWRLYAESFGRDGMTDPAGPA